jgi:hypothetical protein
VKEPREKSFQKALLGRPLSEVVSPGDEHSAQLKKALKKRSTLVKSVQNQVPVFRIKIITNEMV